MEQKRGKFTPAMEQKKGKNTPYNETFPWL
jgi:hypothetical protein